ncbi:MAG: glycerol-3-phosphate 1-O-acyltransferase PlsY [Xanthomonadales bacterium]|nr:glycerol-3-phosphate 1-O-acyltransferase PlsY [Xanthomonadales bacterium]
MTALLAKLLLAYLLGSVVGSLLLGRLRGVDIRRAGSGNAGATNALRTQGRGFALAVAAIDVGKGVAAALVVARLPWFGADLLAPAATGLACGLAAAVGHCYPLWHGLRGGKGAGTAFGTVLALFPGLALVMLLAWLLVLTATGYVGLATVTAAVSFPVALAFTGWRAVPGVFALALAAAALLVWTHRGNLARLRAGKELRFERARILPRLLGRR